MDIEEYKRLYEGRDAPTPGWDAINLRLTEVYGNQEPKHWGTIIRHMFGGKDPIDGISVYESRDGGRSHLHFCTYGYTSLYYDEEAVGGDFSRFGFEMTFRLASELPPPEQPVWVCNFLQNLAKYVFETGKWFEAGHWIPANGPIQRDYPTDIVGLAFVDDPTLFPVDSPHGRIDFVQGFGITESELSDLKSKTRTVKEILAQHRITNPLLITDLARRNG